MLNVAGLALLQYRPARADHSFSGGDCWVIGTPFQCASGYSIGAYYFYHVYQHWATPSSIQFNASIGVENAATAWSGAAGPQLFQTSGYSGFATMNVNVYEFAAYTTGDPVFDNGMYSPPHNGAYAAYAVTQNWKWTGSSYVECYSTACSINFSQIYFSQPWAATCSGGRTGGVWQYVAAHEFGHSQGLEDHLGGGNILMNNSWGSSCTPSSTATGPTSTELGTPVPGGATNCGSPAGIRCIFKWPS